MKNKKAFTLIELLVVVLIIGILAAIALPQYEKAVEKARAAEILSNVNTLSKTVEMYFLSGRTDEIDTQDLEIDLSGGQYSDNGSYYTKNAIYYFVCRNGTYCSISTRRKSCFKGGVIDIYHCDDRNNWAIVRVWQNGQITYNQCFTQMTSTGETICKGLESQGFMYVAGYD